MANMLEVFPLNELTWREVARVALTAGLCKDIGMSDGDTAALLRGKVYSQYVDTTDKMILRLSRCRILHAYSLRHENSEALQGFASGVCAIYRSPSVSTRHAVSLANILRCVSLVEREEAWLVPQLLKRAIAWCRFHSNRADSRRVQQILRQLLQSPYLAGRDFSRCLEYIHRLLSALERGAEAKGCCRAR
ncbi:unnamed protein product [Sphagnum balticum]